MSEKLELSKKTGMHAFLNSLSGTYKGTTKVWFEPGSDPDVSACEGTLTPVLNGMFILHRYTGSLQGKPLEGLAIFGCSLGDDKLQCAWIDSFHNGTAIMFSERNNTSQPWSVLGHYGSEPKWGWRTEINRSENGNVQIIMFNITPEGEEAKAVETVYEKIS